jgi:pimeloyl-ACP methyl ester carboxylesterase
MGRLRTALAAVGSGLGALAATNRLLAGRASDLEPPLPGDTGTYRWRGLDVSYTEAGDPEDPDLLLLHGINAAATSRVFEPVFERLAEEYHVLAPDLPGFGRSERPPLVYSASLYQSFVEEFGRDLTDGAVCVASSLVGAYAAHAAPGAGFRRLVLTCPTDRSMGGRRLGLRTLYRSPLVGTALHNLVVSEPSLRYFSADHGYYDAAKITDEKVDYQWQVGHQPGARFAPASFVSGYLDPEFDLATAIRESGVPTTLVWGREAEVTPLRYGRDLAEDADCRLVVFDYAKLLPHAEHPEEFVDLLGEEVREAATV